MSGTSSKRRATAGARHARLTRCRALSTVLEIAADALADLLVGAAVEVQRQDARLELGQRGRQAARRARASSSEEMTWLHGVVHRGPGITSSRVGSPLERARGRAARTTRSRLSGVCLLRVAVLTAVMIWRVMQSSAKLRKRRLAVGAEVADRLVEADQAFLDEVLAVAAGQEVRRRLQPDEAVVAAHEAGRTPSWSPCLARAMR